MFVKTTWEGQSSISFLPTRKQQRISFWIVANNFLGSKLRKDPSKDHGLLLRASTVSEIETLPPWCIESIGTRKVARIASETAVVTSSSGLSRHPIGCYHRTLFSSSKFRFGNLSVATAIYRGYNILVRVVVKSRLIGDKLRGRQVKFRRCYLFHRTLYTSGTTVKNGENWRRLRDNPTGNTVNEQGTWLR